MEKRKFRGSRHGKIKLEVVMVAGFKGTFIGKGFLEEEARMGKDMV